MSNELFAVTTYCTVHNIDPSFVFTLQKEGLIAIIAKENESFIEEEELHKLEIFTRWHAQLGLHAESMDVIYNLVEKMRQMQEEMNELKMRLRFSNESGQDD